MRTNVHTWIYRCTHEDQKRMLSDFHYLSLSYSLGIRSLTEPGRQPTTASLLSLPSYTHTALGSQACVVMTRIVHECYRPSRLHNRYECQPSRLSSRNVCPLYSEDILYLQSSKLSVLGPWPWMNHLGFNFLENEKLFYLTSITTSFGLQINV